MEESLTPNKKRLISELTKGRDCTKQLQNLLIHQRVVDGGPVSAQDLMMKIIGSFSNSLSTLSSGELYPARATTKTEYVGSGFSDDRTLDLGESEKKPGVRDRRGCYKRRKTEDSRVTIVDTIEDGYAWRKYGQKEILDAKFPRCYYRCTYKDEGCKALKQVQKQEDEPEMFHITYFGSHTCQNTNKKTQMFSHSEDLSFFLLNFENSKTSHSPSSLSTITNARNTPSLKQEDHSNNHDTSSNYSWKDMIGNLESSYDDIFKDGISMDDFNLC
ncbi:putative WRKY transcription factor 70 [Bidens hawaiensis]|uniref:putative WRKY transcription factor 70 n=1 Tax=Bidens hawaiensis TaxID=980011 RepID=UPI00404AA176